MVDQAGIELTEQSGCLFLSSAGIKHVSLRHASAVQFLKDILTMRVVVHVFSLRLRRQSGRSLWICCQSVLQSEYRTYYTKKRGLIKPKVSIHRILKDFCICISTWYNSGTSTPTSVMPRCLCKKGTCFPEARTVCHIPQNLLDTLVNYHANEETKPESWSKSLKCSKPRSNIWTFFSIHEL